MPISPSESSYRIPPAPNSAELFNVSPVNEVERVASQEPVVPLVIPDHKSVPSMVREMTPPVPAVGGSQAYHEVSQISAELDALRGAA